MPSYTEIKRLIEAKAIHSFADFFLFIPQKQFREDTRISVRRLKALMATPANMSLGEANTICRLIGITLADLGPLIMQEHWVKMQ